MSVRTVASLVAVLLGAPLALIAAQTTPSQPLDSVDYASIAVLRQRMASGALSSDELTQSFIRRIASLDQAGPRVNSVIELNPDALTIAKQHDAARKAGKHGPLWGIPILLKDNIGTGDRMLTTAGSLAMTGAPAAHDSTVAAKLREAGAVILGKTNLSEWANFRSTHSVSGWSGRGGLTRNPYVLDRTACGSSAGSGAAVSAGFTTVAIGTETFGSIICPSSINGIVGIKPTVGLVSRAGIVPLASAQDTAGPMARTVRDAAIVLTAIAGSDPLDPATVDADQHATDYTKFLDPRALTGKRIGVVRALVGNNADVKRLLDQTIATLREHGAIVIDPVTIPHLRDYGSAEQTVLLYQFKHGINTYLAARKGLAVHSLADLIAWNEAHAAQEMPWFGQERFIEAEAKGPLTDEAYIEALAKLKQMTGPEGIDATLAAGHLDALLALAQSPAWSIDLVNGDPRSAGGSSPAAMAGYPSITVPAGSVHRLPVGMLFFAGKWSEPTLIGIAYAYEQATHARHNPEFLPTVASPAGIEPYVEKANTLVNNPR